LFDGTILEDANRCVGSDVQAPEVMRNLISAFIQLSIRQSLLPNTSAIWSGELTACSSNS
jgi:hypothetical protein